MSIFLDFYGKYEFFWIFENILIFFGFLWTNQTYRTRQRTDTAISVPFEGLINSLSFILPNWRRKVLKLNLSEKMTNNKIISDFKCNS